MASAPKKFKTEYADVEHISGFVHNVSPVKVGVRNGGKYFNALLQSSREDFRHVVVFAPEKRTCFLQAQKNKSPVKLRRIKKVVSSGGGEFDVQCGKSTEMSVVDTLGFQFKEPPQNAKKTIAEVKLMAPRQQVGLIEVRVYHVKAGTKMVDVRGSNSETQTCCVQDTTGSIDVKLWEDQIGMLQSGHCYQVRNLATREFGGCLYLTSTTSSEFKEVEWKGEALSYPAAEMEEEAITTLTGQITRAEIVVSRRCTKCHAWQRNFNTNHQFHRCEKCGFLQKSEMYQRTASGRLAFIESVDEMDLAVSNFVIKKYLQQEGLLDLLSEGQNIEEHFLCGDSWKLLIESDVVVAIDKVVEPGSGAGAQMVVSAEEDLAGAIAAIQTDGC